MPKRIVPRSERSLACFVQALDGLPVVVELHTDAIVRGHLESADEGMNLVLTGASFQPLQGSQQSMDFLFIKGSSIRYIHLPGSLNVANRVEAKQKEVADARKAYAVALGQQAALPKGEDVMIAAQAAAEQECGPAGKDSAVGPAMYASVHR